ncbi:MAG: radical SAM protein [Candidatus Thorarchaeota archaeon]|nr:radical SAM protein [Candidatus Thorarchaeota archaeon]
MDSEDILQLKVRLLTEGAVISESESPGRRGGAGPVGGKYLLLPNGKPCGVPIRYGKMAERFSSATLEPTEDPNVWIYDKKVELRAVMRPKFYDMETSDGIPYHKIALLHGASTLATTIYQSCRYWSTGMQCKFCTIPTSHLLGDTILEKGPEQIAEVVKAAEEEGVISDVLLTTGTPPEETDMGGARLLRIAEAIRKVSAIPIAVQIEPPIVNGTIQDLARAGVNAIGIHIESADESIREEFCPGKFEYGPLDLYQRTWQKALDFFGRGRVSTFILHGLGENLENTLNLVEELSEVGIISVLTPIRPAKGSQLADYIPPYVGHLKESVDFYKRVGESLFKWDLNPDDTKAGCHKCGGCTPIQEAYDWAKANA